MKNPLLVRPQKLEDFLKRFVYVVEGDRVYDLAMPAHAAMLQMKEFVAMNAGPVETTIGPRGGVKVTSITKIWLNDPARLIVRGEAYDPSAEKIVDGGDGLEYINVFTFPAHPTGNPELAEPFFDHLRYLIPDEDRHNLMMMYLAHIVQRPCERPKISPLLVARHHGTGRGFIVEMMNAVLGSWNCSTTKVNKLADGQFHDFLHRRLFTAIHECRVGERRYKVDDQIRDRLTESRLDLNLKYGKQLPNEAVYSRVFMMSNHPDALAIPKDDRRIWVHETVNNPKTEEYYDQLYAWIPEGAKHVYAALKLTDISGFSHGMRAPITPEKQQMQGFAQSQTEEALLDMVEKLPEGLDVMTAGQIQEAIFKSTVHDEDRVKKVGYVLREHGTLFNPGNQDSKIHWNDRTVRAWILRNHQKWRTADKSEIRDQLNDAAVWLEQVSEACIIPAGNLMFG